MSYLGLQKMLVCLHLPDQNYRAKEKAFFFFFSFFTFLRFFSPEIDIFGLKTFQKVYVKNTKDIYGDS